MQPQCDVEGLVHGARCGRVCREEARKRNQNDAPAVCASPLFVLLYRSVHNLEIVKARLFAEHSVRKCGDDAFRLSLAADVVGYYLRRRFYPLLHIHAFEELGAQDITVSCAVRQRFGRSLRGHVQESVQIDAHSPCPEQPLEVRGMERALELGAVRSLPLVCCAAYPSR